MRHNLTPEVQQIRSHRDSAPQPAERAHDNPLKTALCSVVADVAPVRIRLHLIFPTSETFCLSWSVGGWDRDHWIRIQSVPHILFSYHMK